jgi:hypothetical protein
MRKKIKRCYPLLIIGLLLMGFFEVNTFAVEDIGGGSKSPTQDIGSGSKSPAHDIYSSGNNTPAQDIGSGSKTPAQDIGSGSKTPAEDIYYEGSASAGDTQPSEIDTGEPTVLQGKVEEKSIVSSGGTTPDDKNQDKDSENPGQGDSSPQKKPAVHHPEKGPIPPLEGRVEDIADDNPANLTPQTPQLDTRGGSNAGSGKDNSTTNSNASGTISPATTTTNKPGSGTKRSHTSVRTDVKGEILGTGGSSTRLTDVEVKNTAQKLESALNKGIPGQKGTVNHPFTRGYFFTQGVLLGVLDGASQTSGSMARVQVATYYILTGRPIQAQNVLGLKESDTTIKQMQKGIKQWQQVVNDVDTPHDLHRNGRFAGKQLANVLISKFAGKLSGTSGLSTPQGTSLPTYEPSE